MAAAEVLVAGGARSSFRCRKVGGIAFNVEDHVTGAIADDCIGVRSAVVEELGEGLKSGGGAVGLLRGKCSDGGQHGGVDGASVEKQGA
jgi:hypothetical protein